MPLRRSFTLILQAALLSAGVAFGADTWDNYPSDTYTSSTYYSAERDTQAGPSFVIDDAHFSTSVDLLHLDWIGLRQKLAPPMGYDRADFTILTRDASGTFTEIPQLAAGQGKDVGFSILRDDLGSVGNLTVYEGHIDFQALGLPLSLAPGEYWFGVRLVAASDSLYMGRNFMAGSLNLNPLGSPDGAYLLNPPAGIFAYTKSAFVFAEPRDFAFRVGYVPEPATLIVLVIGGLVAYRRPLLGR
jgi:hypothetical protein